MTAAADPAGVPRSVASASPAAATLAGTPELAKLAYKRDRVLLPIWVYLVLVGTLANAYMMGHLYKTAAARAALAASGEGNPALIFLYGRLNSDSAGGLTAWRYGVWAALFAALMAIFTVIRHTRANEETGRQELIGSARVGRQAPLFAALLVSGVASVLLAVLLAAILPFLGLPVAGSVSFGLAVGASGLAFTGITAFCAQLSSSARAARGLALAVLGLAFCVRAVGDASGGSVSWLTWVSPLGWPEVLRPYAGERWWVLALSLTVFLAGTWLAFFVSARRDLGAGVLSDRPGRPFAASWLRGPVSLAWRLQRTTLLWWAVGFAFVFGVSGAAGNGIGSLAASSSAMRTEFAQLGGQAAIVNAYLAALMLMSGLGAAAYGVSTVLRLRWEETGALAEPVLAAAVGRLHWGLSHLLVAVIGSAVLLAVGGVTAGLGYRMAASGSSPGSSGGVSGGVSSGVSGGVSVGEQVARMLVAGLAQLPAVLVIAGLAVLAFGLVPRASGAVCWTAFAVPLVLSLFGQTLKLSHWVLDVSPFTHAPRLPGGSVAAAPLIWLSVIFLVLAGIGLAGLRRRDIG